MLFSAVFLGTLATLAATTVLPILPVLPSKSVPSTQVITSCVVPNTAALTFDDGPYMYIYNISKALTDVGAKGTFFMNGNNWGCIYTEENVARVKFAYGQGHQVGSHTWSHAHLTNLTRDQLQDEFSRTEQAIQRITGAVPAFTRPPYGEFNDQVRQVAALRQQTLVNWDFDSQDTLGKTAAETNEAYDELVKSHPRTILALNHEIKEQTAHVVVPHAISVLRQAGYKLVTVAECLGQNPYRFTGKPSERDDSWKC